MRTRSSTAGALSPTRLPSFDAGSTSSRTGLNVSRVASAGLAIESELLKGFRAMAGIGGRYSYGRNDSSESTTSSSRKTETLNDSMTWGASYQYRRLQLTGQLASDLNLQDLFGTLDLVVTL